MNSQDRGAALIIGGSSGIGLAIARQFASNGHDVVLAARDTMRLAAAAAEVASVGPVKVATISIDATSDDAPQLLALEASKATIKYVVLATGFWSSGPTAAEEFRRLLEYNVLAQHRILEALLPSLQPGAGLLFVGSLAGSVPMPGFAGYAASKACLHSGVISLRQHLGARGMSVSLLAPGPVNTPFMPRSPGTMRQLVIDLLASSPDAVAHAAYCGLKAGTSIIVPGLLWRLAWLGLHLVPVSAITKLAYQSTSEAGLGSGLLRPQ